MPENTSPDQNMLNWALSYYERGWQVFPCTDKRPLLTTWRYLADYRIKKDKVIEWWTRWPNAQIGMACGGLSGVTVVDVDWLKDPLTHEILYDKSIKPEKLAEKAIDPPRSITGSGGIHLFYKYFESGNSVKSIHPQLDIKTYGGLIILPPSVHPNGKRYAWDTSYPDWFLDLPDAPEELIKSTKRIVRQTDWVKIARGVSYGSRNNTAAQFTGKIIPKFRNELELAWEILEAWNARNNPPLSEAELKHTFESILKKDYAQYERFYRRNTPRT